MDVFEHMAEVIADFYAENYEKEPYDSETAETVFLKLCERFEDVGFKGFDATHLRERFSAMVDARVKI